MKLLFEIKHRFSGVVLFAIETESWSMAVEAGQIPWPLPTKEEVTKRKDK